ncbi:acetate kinase [Exiguobacterium profundum]|jgi:acetate kinase|uniref:Acetate kinase n=2 Tax=Exiguobacterium TaxID=33986 RepID=ACKA_EXISA|nr:MULTISPECIES: acetate kinase [Exiguobacterium]C4L493.1 RecName: Full=Acetate kinase; AltName: Full=Acetokinase [Exiguobacterium sp. AT1b]QPI68689.1 acetate kinase [Exiguobacterium sp. PBE]ACQ69615.1 acetate kinase [Exiguobacterium sp. AT1b]MBG0917456.1 acetate kinase [Exiguobacterium sp. SRB7LM]MCM3279118.1 acetate kinase [Exiguobacterium sp. MER 193]MCT4797865.1 acetate kinase [Exiguobacterium profundum]
MTKIMAVNAGSSSLKFQLLEMPTEELLAVGLVERVGKEDAIFTIKYGEGQKFNVVTPLHTHKEAVELTLEKLIELDIIQSFDEISGVGHRVLHGKELYADSVVIDDEVMKNIESFTELGPLHIPPNLTGIRAFQAILPNVPQVAVFDTAFHQSMPEENFLYSLPYEYYTEHGVRKYGFHGTSHKYVTQRAAELLGRPLEDLRLISCHLGSGASIAAVAGGRSIDTTMGFTPLEGITMGTRSGSLDPALIPFLMQKTGKSAEDVLNVMNKESGVYGLSGISSDLRDIEQAAAEGNHRAEVSLKIFSNRIHGYIGQYAAEMNGVDAIIFTAGVGENSDVIRERILRGLEFMGVYWDPSLNNGARGKELFINYPHSPVKVIIIPTNEELVIARDTVRIANLVEAHA